MIERKVGEVFTFENVKLKVKINGTCVGCYFEYYDMHICSEIKEICGMCGAIQRKDGNQVIFSEVPKVKTQFKL